MAFQEAVQQCSKSQINDTVLKELLVVKPGASLNHSDVLIITLYYLFPLKQHILRIKRG